MLGKAKATLQYTVPHDQAVVDEEQAKLQQAINGMVMHGPEARDEGCRSGTAAEGHGARYGERGGPNGSHVG